MLCIMLCTHATALPPSRGIPRQGRGGAGAQAWRSVLRATCSQNWACERPGRGERLLQAPGELGESGACTDCAGPRRGGPRDRVSSPGGPLGDRRHPLQQACLLEARSRGGASGHKWGCGGGGGLRGPQMLLPSSFWKREDRSAGPGHLPSGLPGDQARPLPPGPGVGRARTTHP